MEFKELIAQADEAVAKADATIRGIDLREANVKMTDTYRYDYLEAEDMRFCQAFRLTETQFFKFLTARSSNTQVFALIGNRYVLKAVLKYLPLPSSVEPYLERMKYAGVSDEAFCKELVSEQKVKVAGLVSLAVAKKRMEEEAATRFVTKVADKERELAALRKHAALAYCWGENSQSARDWADQEYSSRYGK